MEKYYSILNGKLVDADAKILTAQNRGFKYGDGVFETIRIVGGMPFNVENHVSRMLNGMRIIKMNVPKHYTTSYFEELIEQLSKSNRIMEGGRARITVFREGSGAFIPESNDVRFLISVEAYDHNGFTLNKDGLNIGLYQEYQKTVDRLSVFKTCNSLPYILAGVYAKENNYDDVLILNSKGSIIEAVSSNIFIVSNGVLYTPSLDDGCVGGTMRMNVINCAIANGIKVYECSLSPQNLLAADEIFLTNAISGINWVSGYKTKRYFHSVAGEMIRLVNASISNLKLDFQES